MNRSERLAAASLAGIFSLRMLGLFLVLPVFALYAAELPGATPAKVGFALGAYGLAQVLLGVLFGSASDRFGRKPVITFGLLLFAGGSWVCAQATSMDQMIWGRLLQGSGAIASAITAMIADLTREEYRTRAMAMLGGSIAISFAVSLVAAPPLAHRVGLDGIFTLVALLALLAVPYLWLVVPSPPVERHHRDMELTGADLRRVLTQPELLRLNLGVFVLHMAMTAVFVAVPGMLASHLPRPDLWKVYLPVILLSFAIMVPSTIMAEARGKIRQVMRLGVATVALSFVVLGVGGGGYAATVIGLFVFFVGFNMLEPILPSLVTKFAPTGARGTCVGVFNTAQFLGPFVGGAFGGFLLGVGPQYLFGFLAASTVVWLLVAWGMAAPVPYRQVVVPLALAGGADPALVERAIAALEGVGGVRLFIEEGEAHVRFVGRQVTVEQIFAAARGAGQGA
ncbi:MAG: MFS transporter [Nitrospirota bacterium]|nr:MFS transporter [Nitrospirota bacterium]